MPASPKPYLGASLSGGFASTSTSAEEQARQDQKRKQKQREFGYTETQIPLWQRQAAYGQFGEDSDAQRFGRGALMDIIRSFTGEKGTYNDSAERAFQRAIADVRDPNLGRSGTAHKAYREAAALQFAHDANAKRAQDAAAALLSDANPFMALDFLSRGNRQVKSNTSVLDEIASVFSKKNATSKEDTMGLGGTGGCCFIFMEAFKNETLPETVRICRDLFVTTERNAGYRKMASWLVPMMDKSRLIANLVNIFMIAPLIAFGDWILKGKGFGWIFFPFLVFWFAFWSLTGKK
jgi:hypothetical protein